MKKTLLAAGVMATLLGTVVLAQTAGTTTAEDLPIPAEMRDGMGMGPGMGMGDDMGMRGMMGAFGPMGADFATLDADGDDAITEADLAARAAARFAQADADGSGGLTAAEMVAMAEIIRQEQMAARMAARVAQIDDSADGEIQLEELQARAPAAVHFFDNFDTDNDGAISPDEFAAAQEQMAAMHENHGPRDGGGWGFWNRGGDEHGMRHR